MVRIVPGEFDDQRILALLRHHFEKCHEVTPPGSAHVFDVVRLNAPDVDFWAAWEGETLLGVGAMKQLDGTHGEIKSMHTSEAAWRKGVGGAILRHIIATARQRPHSAQPRNRLLRLFPAGRLALPFAWFHGVRTLWQLQARSQQHLPDAGDRLTS